jgi:hypothetical protein
MGYEKGPAGKTVTANDRSYQYDSNGNVHRVITDNGRNILGDTTRTHTDYASGKVIGHERSNSYGNTTFRDVPRYDFSRDMGTGCSIGGPGTLTGAIDDAVAPIVSGFKKGARVIFGGNNMSINDQKRLDQNLELLGEIIFWILVSPFIVFVILGFVLLALVSSK